MTKVSISATLDSNTKEAVDKEAEKEKRRFSPMLSILLDEALAARATKETPAKTEIQKLVLVFLLCCGATLFSCQTTPKALKQNQTTENKHDAPIFHIKAKYWYDCQWQVLFTNDNFDTEENIMNCWDGSGKYVGNSIVHQLIIFKTENDAITFAKRFTSYQICRQWNDSVARRAGKLTDFRKQHPIEKDIEEEQPSCKNEVGKEVIVN